MPSSHATLASHRRARWRLCGTLRHRFSMRRASSGHWHFWELPFNHRRRRRRASSWHLALPATSNQPSSAHMCITHFRAPVLLHTVQGKARTLVDFGSSRRRLAPAGQVRQLDRTHSARRKRLCCAEGPFAGAALTWDSEHYFGIGTAGLTTPRMLRDAAQDAPHHPN